MRFVPTFCLREGMILGNNLIGDSGELIFAENTVLTYDYVQGIRKLNYNGIYIEDDLSKDIQIVNIINDQVRSQTVKGIKDIFICTENKSPVSKKKFKNMQNQISLIVDEILENKNMMVNMVDLKVFDDYTYFHSVNVAVLSIVIGTALGFGKEGLYNLEGADISLFGRIISITDVYDAMTSDRPYRKGIIPSEVIEYIMGSSYVLFDPDLVKLFIRKIAPYPIGTFVKLSNDLTGIVTENFESYCMRPKIRIFKVGGA